MNRFLSVLLIPLFVLGQALPHSHAGSGMVEPVDHAARPHLHLFLGHSPDHTHHDDGDHDRDHGEQVDSVDSTSVHFLSTHDDHDSDAVYLVKSDTSLSRSLSVERAGCPIAFDFVELCFDWPKGLAFGFANLLPDRPAGLPIYLLVGSLRL